MTFRMKNTPYPSKKFSIKKSDIQGEAVTDVVNFRDARTQLGKYLNHQSKENAALKSENNTLNIYTKNAITKGEEITVNYKKGPNYIDGDLTGFKEK